MERAKSFGIKLTVFTIITFSFFGIFNDVSVMNLFLMAFVVTGVTFIVDMLVLQRINNFLLIIGDFVLFALLFWMLGIMFVETSMPIVLVSIAAAYLATIAEAIIHIYINERVFGKYQQPTPLMSDLQTEFAEETDAQDIKEKMQIEEEIEDNE